jgi:hypothetical protein
MPLGDGLTHVGAGDEAGGAGDEEGFHDGRKYAPKHSNRQVIPAE